MVASALSTETDLASSNVGDLQFFDENKQPVAMATALATTAKSFYVGVKVNDDNEFYMSDRITRDKIEAVTAEDYRGYTPSYATVTFDTPVAGQRYVLRIAYRDVIEMPIQFTQSFEVWAKAGDTATTLATKFTNAINSTTTSAGRNARVTASDASGVLTLTAKDITIDNKVDTLYEFHAIEIEDVTLTTNGDPAFTAKTVNAADFGSGYWKIVRDIEKRNLGYQGSMFFNIDKWMPFTGTQMVEKGEQYDTVEILYNNDYRSADNQFVKSTPLHTTIFIKSGLGATIYTALLAWANAADAFSADADDSTDPNA